MKRILTLALAALLMCAPALAEEDYSFLDDMTINQLRALDAEIHKRLPQDEPEPAPDSETSAAETILKALFGGSTTTAVEPVPLEVGEQIITDFAEFKVLEISFLRTKKGSSSGWLKASGYGVTGSFYVDSDCSLLKIFYRVKNTSTSSKWFWPSNLDIKVQWGDYTLEKPSARPFGDLQSTQTKTYVAVVEVPNSLMEAGCDDIVIDIGFKKQFADTIGLDSCDFRYTLHTSY